MQRSTDRILTTHAGSLVRTPAIVQGMRALALGEPYDRDQLNRDIQAGVAEVVRKQVEAGIDVPSDGEYRGRTFGRHVVERFGGLHTRPLEPEDGKFVSGGRWLTPNELEGEWQAFPEFFLQYSYHFRELWLPPGVSIDGVPSDFWERFTVTGPITYTGQAAIQRDIQNFTSALQGLTVGDAFMSSVSPGQKGVRGDKNMLEFYESDEAYLYAFADALHEEYQAITNAGLLLQVDLGVVNPRRQMAKDEPTEDEVRHAREIGVEVINHALRGIPEERVRYHHCWGSMNSPHTRDVPLRNVVDMILKVHAQAYGVEAANPRHEHEWMVWQDVKLPDGKILMPGLVSQSTNVVEHPELIAWRIKNFASVVGKENLIVGTDCGFSQYWDMARVHPSVQWAKLKALADGAALASRELYSSAATERSHDLKGVDVGV
jgi:5-methyltetrahydropteroyltriglutamate--homocysteine methyltransferase